MIYKLNEIISFNPPESINNNSIAKKVAMEKLLPYYRKITGYEYANYSSGPKFRNGDTLVAKITPCLENGKTAYVDILDDNEVAFGSSEFIVLRAKPELIDKEFLYYLAISPIFRYRAISCMEGTSGRKRVNENTLKNFSIKIPDITTQKKITAILSAIDKKIQTNKQINYELEAIAKKLYYYWFIQFDFPNKNGKPYKTSGGKMVYNDLLKREIPKGWEVCSINNMTSSYRGVTYNKDDLLQDSKGGVLVLRGNNIHDNTLIYDNNVAYIPDFFVSDEQHIKKYDIILTMSSGSKDHIGKCVMFQHDSQHTFGAFLIKFKPQEDKPFFIYHSMISDYFKQKIKSICSGTGINNLTNQTFDEILFPVPDSYTLSNYEKQLKPLYMRIGSNYLENEKLLSLRDYLLPLLMNGQITVSDVEKTVDNVIPFNQIDNYNQKYDKWIKNQGIAARGEKDKQTKREIFDLMDDDDK